MAFPAWAGFAPTFFSTRQAMCFGVIPDHTKNAAQLGLPPVIDKIAEERRD